MNDQVRKQLCQIVTRYGASILEDPRRCPELLNDLCGDHRREITGLVAAPEERVRGRIMAPGLGLPVKAVPAQQV